MKHGKPEFIRSDNGLEFIVARFQDWLKRVGIQPLLIYPGTPWENVYNERFKGTLRQEVLNAEWFPQHQTSSGHNQRLTKAIQPDQTSSRIGHDSTRP